MLTLNLFKVRTSPRSSKTRRRQIRREASRNWAPASSRRQRQVAAAADGRRKRRRVHRARRDNLQGALPDLSWHRRARHAEGRRAGRERRWRRRWPGRGVSRTIATTSSRRCCTGWPARWTVTTTPRSWCRWARTRTTGLRRPRHSSGPDSGTPARSSPRRRRAGQEGDARAEEAVDRRRAGRVTADDAARRSRRGRSARVTTAQPPSYGLNYVAWSTGEPQKPGMWFQVELPEPAMLTELVFETTAGGRGGVPTGAFGTQGPVPGRGAAPASRRPGGRRGRQAPAAPARGRGAAAGGAAFGSPHPGLGLSARVQRSRSHSTGRNGRPPQPAPARQARSRRHSRRCARSSCASRRQATTPTRRPGLCSGCGFIRRLQRNRSLRKSIAT